MIQRLLSAFSAWFWRDLSLIAWGWLLLAVQPLVPLGHPLARPDLVPWMTLTGTVVALLRARAIGEGAHPMLTPRSSTVAALLRRLGAAAVPGALFAWYELGRGAPLNGLWIALGASAGVAALLALGREHGETAWEPEGRPAWVLWVGLAVPVVAGAVGGGLIDRLGGRGLLSGLGASLLVGCAFLGTSMACGRAVHLTQREAAGRKDGRPWRPRLFHPFLSLFGPSVGLWSLIHLYQALFGPVGYEQAFLGSLHVVAWAAVLWAPPPPVGVAVLLHEVVPTGGEEEAASETATSFERPPEGALRLNPLAVRRTMAVHPWVVPVFGQRIGDLDDPIRPLWSRPPPPPPGHVLGEAIFQPDPRSGRAQTHTLSIRVRGQADTSQLSGGDVQARRFVVLRAFPSSLWFRPHATTTYRWDAALHPEAVQVLDGATAELRLRDGDILVSSTEGVARAYEVELGAPVAPGHPLMAGRLPQIEDYSKGG